MAKLIGLSGYARSGKDTVADILVRDYGFTKLSFAKPMRDALYALNPIVAADNEFARDSVIRVQDVIDTFGWDGYKESGWGQEIRELMQRLGTEVGRNIFGEDFWVNLAIENLPINANIVFTDVRFVNEAIAIKKLNGEVWRVRRPGVLPANAHASEIALDDYAFDKYIDNNGSLEDLELMLSGHF